MNSHRLKLSAMSCAVVVLASSGCASNLDQRITYAQGVPDGAASAPLGSHANSYGATGHVAARAGELQRTQLVRHASSPWIGGIQTVARTEDKLPAIFHENFVLDFGTSKVSLPVVVARLTKLTNIPVRLRMDKKEEGAGSPVARASSIPSPILQTGAALPKVLDSKPPMLPPLSAAIPASAVSAETEINVDAVNMKWNGRLRDFLDHLTNTLSLSWEYTDGAVVICVWSRKPMKLRHSPVCRTSVCPQVAVAAVRVVAVMLA